MRSLLRWRVWILRNRVYPRPLRALARVPASWREARQCIRANPLFALQMRRNLRADQLFLLAAATGFSAVLLGVLKANVPSPTLIVIWAAARWGIGEFLWTWMAADHAFSTIMNARSGRQLRDWRLTALGPQELAAALIHSTWMFVALGVLIWGAVELVLPFDYSWPPGIHGTFSALLWQIGFPLVLTWNHIATAHFASASCCSNALASQRGVTDWAVALFKIGGLLLLLLGGALVLLLSCTMATGYRMSELCDELLMDPRLLLFWLALLAILPPGFKYGLAWMETKSAIASCACDADPEELAFPPSSRRQSKTTRSDGQP